MELRSPAKINLFLKILGKREDGFHEIETHMQAISLFDTLHLEKSSRDTFTCSDPTLLQDNLVLKALALFRKTTGIADPVSLHLEKRIPTQAGLGGGSSNAATTLRGLSKLFSVPFDPTLSASLGSDVPFFFSSGSAICRGRGEKIEEIPFVSESYTLFFPQVCLPTPDVYKALLPSDYCSQKNDLEAAAFRLHPPLREFKKSMVAKTGSDVWMSGSGSTFFSHGTHEGGEHVSAECLD